ncbi:MAG: Ser-Thr-rich GPI-anchored membrane family protein [Syntrophomonadaceae bacterium]
MNKKLFSFVFLFSLVQMFFGCREKLDLTDSGPGTNLLITSTDTPNVLYLTTPSPGEVLLKGVQFPIRWFVSPSVKTVSLTLFKKTEEITGISGATDNDGQFTWRIPITIPSSSHYRIKLSNTVSPDEFIFSDYFTITATSDSTE